MRTVRAGVFINDVACLEKFTKLRTVLWAIICSDSFWPTKSVEPVMHDLSSSKINPRPILVASVISSVTKSVDYSNIMSLLIKSFSPYNPRQDA